MRKAATKISLISSLLLAGKTKAEIFNELRPMVLDQIDPLVFRMNVGGTRVPKTIPAQLIDFRHAISRIAAGMDRDDSSFDHLRDEDFIGDELPMEDESQDEPQEDESQEDEIEEDETPKIRKSRKAKAEDELNYFWRKMNQLREFCRSRAELSAPVDSLESMRPEQAASKLIPAGIPADALIAARTIHWPDEAKRENGIGDFDFVSLSRRIMAEREISEVLVDGEMQDLHEMFGYVLLLAESRQPIYLYGPAGTGKSHVAKQLAAHLELSYGETPISAGATRGDLLGRQTIKGFIISQFAAQYGNGGIFNFEEIDAAVPETLIVLNNALAGNALYNSSDGEMYSRSQNFIPVSTANTLGIGANREYTARERLDFATLDRWMMGRVFIPRDDAIARKILLSQVS